MDPSCYSCCKLCERLWIRKWPDCDYDKWNISEVICLTKCSLLFNYFVFGNIIRIFTFRFNRVVEEEVSVGGYTIPKGVDIQFPICVVHRDPNLWPDPEMFDPERLVFVLCLSSVCVLYSKLFVSLDYIFLIATSFICKFIYYTYMICI